MAMAISQKHVSAIAAYLPDAISLLRVPLAVVFPFTLSGGAGHLAPLAVLIAAGATDVLDGWVARRTKHVTSAGSAIDAVADKVFAFTVLVSLLVSRRMGLLEVALLSVREIGEAPLVVRYLLRRAHPPAANALGKITTTLQFAAIASVLTLSSWEAPRLMLAVFAAIAGAASVLSYWRRVW